VGKAKAIADRLGVDTSQLALAWVLTRGENVCIIPGTTKKANLESNLRATEVAERLTAEDLELLNSIEPFSGSRYLVGPTYNDNL